KTAEPCGDHDRGPQEDEGMNPFATRLQETQEPFQEPFQHHRRRDEQRCNSVPADRVHQRLLPLCLASCCSTILSHWLWKKIPGEAEDQACSRRCRSYALEREVISDPNSSSAPLHPVVLSPPR